MNMMLLIACRKCELMWESDVTLWCTEGEQMEECDITPWAYRV